MRSQAVIQQKQVASKQRKVQDQVCHSKSLPPSHSDINITVFSWYQQLEEAANQVTKVSQFRVFSTQHGDRGLNGHHLATDYTDCHPWARGMLIEALVPRCGVIMTRLGARHAASTTRRGRQLGAWSMSLKSSLLQYSVWGSETCFLPEKPGGSWAGLWGMSLEPIFFVVTPTQMLKAQVTGEAAGGRSS